MSSAKVAPIVAEMVVTDGKVKLVDEFGFSQLAKHRAKKWGEGCMLVVRIEPRDEAWRHSDAKHLYGHLYQPVSKRTGETVAEVHLRMKVQFMPDDGRTSITELNREELRSFIESVEQDIRENDPDSWGDCLDAMAIYENRRTA